MDASYINLIGWFAILGFILYVVIRLLRVLENWPKH